MESEDPVVRDLLLDIMDWLEMTRNEHITNEAISNEDAAQVYMENYALTIFKYADKLDRGENFGRSLVRNFFTSGLIYDTLQAFGDLSDEANHNRNYAKAKASYIRHCLNVGVVPLPGPVQANMIESIEFGAEDDGIIFDADTTVTAPVV